MSKPVNVVHTIRHNYASTNVTTLAYVEISSALPVDVRRIQVFDSSGQTLKLSYGPTGSEVVACQIFPGGIDIDLLLNKGMRLAIIAVSGDAVVGECTINFLR